jgi:cation:H+ antiporter
MNPYILFIFSLSALIYGSDLIINSSKYIAFKFNIPKLIIGVTVIAFGTSFPELIVGMASSIQNQGDIALSNVVGSNIANLGLVLGIIGLIRPIHINVNRKLSYNLMSCMLATISFIVIIYLYDGVSLMSGYLLLILFLIYMYNLFSNYKRDNSLLNMENENFNFSIVFKLFLGFVLVAFGTEYFIESTVNISNQFGFKNNIAISMSLVAFGTSVPELVTSVMAVLKKEEGLAIGNIIGSNIFNIFLVAGLSSIVNPIVLNFDLIKYHLLLMFLVTIIFILFAYLFKKISRVISTIFICIYFVFLYINFS